MKKKIVIAGTVMLLVLCFGAAGAMAGKVKGKDRCVELGYDWGGSGSYGYTYVWLYADGWFATEDGGEGYWMKNGSAFALQYVSGCEPLYAGTKSRGFMACTDGGGEEGLYVIKSTKKRNCEETISDNATAIQGDLGPSSFLPE